MKGIFVRAFVGASSGKTDEGVPIICVDEFVAEHEIERIDILHSDIQGAEFDMLRGANKAFDSGIIDYVFISTHTNALHKACRSFLLEHGLAILADADLHDPYSEDGVIVGRRDGLDGAMPITISTKPRSLSSV